MTPLSMIVVVAWVDRDILATFYHSRDCLRGILPVPAMTIELQKSQRKRAAVL